MNHLTALAVLLLLAAPVTLPAQNKETPKDSTHFRELESIEVYTQRVRQVKKDTLSNALKLQQPLLEIPQNIISIASALLQQQGALQLKDAARNASGIYFGYNSSPFDYSAAIQIRGFTGYTTLNGMPRHVNYGAVLDDQALFESIEFVKGPAGFINSVGEASGTVNINSKTPNRKLLNVELTGGSFHLGRIAIDAGSQVKNKGFSYRFNTVYQHQDSYLQLLRTDKYVVAPVVQYNFNPNTYLLGEYHFIRGESRNGSDITKIRSVADALHDPIEWNFNAAKGLPLTYYQTHTGRLLFVHKFNDHWQLTSQSQYTHAPYSSWNLLSSETYTGVSFDANGRTDRTAMHSAVTGKTFVTQAYVSGRFHTRRMQHLLIAGGDFTSSRDQLSNAFGVYAFPFFRDKMNDQVNADSVKQLNPAGKSLFGNNTYYESVYAYDQLRLGRHWQLTAGGRYTWYNNKLTQQAIPALPVKRKNFLQNAFSPRAALTFLADSSTTLFLLYDQSFVPQSGLKAGKTINPQTGKPDGIAVDPQRNNDLELGIKRQWFGGKLLTTLNGFHTIKRNVLIPDVQNASLGYKRQIGQYASDGIELDVIGQLDAHWSVSANYTFVHARITKDTAGSPLIGLKLPGTPRQIINSWLQYSMPLRSKHLLSFSLGQSTLVKRATYTRDTYLPDYTKLDAGIGLVTPRYTLRLVADNLANKRYFVSGDIGNGYPIPDVDNYFFVEGEPLNFRLSLGIKL